MTDQKDHDTPQPTISNYFGGRKNVYRSVQPSATDRDSSSSSSSFTQEQQQQQQNFSPQYKHAQPIKTTTTTSLSFTTRQKDLNGPSSSSLIYSSQKNSSPLSSIFQKNFVTSKSIDDDEPFSSSTSIPTQAPQITKKKEKHERKLREKNFPCCKFKCVMCKTDEKTIFNTLYEYLINTEYNTADISLDKAYYEIWVRVFLQHRVAELNINLIRAPPNLKCGSTIIIDFQRLGGSSEVASTFYNQIVQYLYFKKMVNKCALPRSSSDLLLQQRNVLKYGTSSSSLLKSMSEPNSPQKLNSQTRTFAFTSTINQPHKPPFGIRINTLSRQSSAPPFLETGPPPTFITPQEPLQEEEEEEETNDLMTSTSSLSSVSTTSSSTSQLIFPFQGFCLQPSCSGNLRLERDDSFVTQLFDMAETGYQNERQSAIAILANHMEQNEVILQLMKIKELVDRLAKMISNTPDAGIAFGLAQITKQLLKNNEHFRERAIDRQFGMTLTKCRKKWIKDVFNPFFLKSKQKTPASPTISKIWEDCYALLYQES